ncbi:hypothetical protein N7532_003037 [Penicillium argentinense]|uniref:HAT C-terminal dimerisation domain-containing protein n=1 Tax=Penicillium argentinense TaxID=1131581 RepID=A0A9W9KBK5_9EURO|nr:uncharacterized protein N7532_010153 [Penicillium argentinense]XP_056473085.1 uncharacterized protein N7532_007226 [Penicillium argentinense]XP_056474701.1 uncharacterized protein N7532_006048 [Penicillium argentinense]XP_056475822.1 uncharacterized protein N7532_007170 [Penicillium argentinense]XP_056475888.1 uncharacterized protein N7532_003037 [Penicillium argentinense]KAJ5085382.1 hypothetical protein N7532_010153 [Penicillium argentinense]KAJ5094935.1 hypothetical protein N7532_007226
MDESTESQRKRPYRSQRINYCALNDGIDEEAPPEDRIIEIPPSKRARSSVEPITPDDSASQLSRARSPLVAICSQNELTAEALPDVVSISNESGLSRRKMQNQALWAHFDCSPLPGRMWWPKRGKGPINDREVRCKRCNWKTTDSTRATSTSNMMFHLSKHGIILSGPENSSEDDRSSIKQPSVSSFFQKRTEEQRAKVLEQNLVRWVVIDDMAFDAIESPPFQQIFQDLGVSLPFASRMTMARRIDRDFDNCREQLIEELEQTCQTISLSLDAWTSKNSKAMFGVVGHWLTVDFQYRERVLEFTELHGIHSGENMAEILQTLLTELRIEHKLLAITADNATSNERLLSELYLNLTEKFQAMYGAVSAARALRFQGVDSYIRCTAHVLNLIVSDILVMLQAGDHASANAACDLMQENKEIGPQSPLARLRIMALWIARTPQRKQQWKIICQSNGLKDKFIEYDVDTRWNSTHRMLRDALNAKQQIKKWIHHQLDFPPFSAEDWDRLQQIEGFLARFEEFTLTVSKRQPQITLAIPIYYELHDLLHDAASREGEFSDLHLEISAAAAAGLKKFQKYYNLMDGQDAYYVALVLDPRFKTLLLDRDLGKLTAPQVVTHIKELLHDQYPLAVDSSAKPSKEQPSLKKSIEARLLQKLQPKKKHSSDIDRYFEDDVVTINESISQDKNWLLSWWRAQRNEYPQLATAARDYLAIPASSVSVERLFNKGRDLLGVRRNTLSAETMRRLMLLRDIYLSEEY